MVTVTVTVMVMVTVTVAVAVTEMLNVPVTIRPKTHLTR